MPRQQNDKPPKKPAAGSRDGAAEDSYQPPPLPPGRGAGAAAAMRRLEMSLRPTGVSVVHVVFRAPRRHYRQLLYQLIQEGVIAKGQCYHPDNLRRWTLGLPAKLRSDAPMGAAMHAVAHRLGLNDAPVAFCLDGFYGAAAEFGNIFGADEAPRALVQPGSTPASLHLQDGDCIFISLKE